MKKLIKKFIIICINVIIFFLKVFLKKKENFLIFSSGDNFSGNPKYLYLYFSNLKKLNCYWFTGDKNIEKYLKSKNLKVINRWSIKAIILTVISKYFFISSGINNICEYKVVEDTVVVNLWHGTPIKKIFKDQTNKGIEFKESLKNHFKGFDNFIVGSKNLTETFKKSICDNRITIYPYGAPANDILYKSKNDETFKHEIINKVKKHFDIKSDKKIILYCPTHRDNINHYNLNYLNIFYEKILKFSEMNNYIFFNKFHPLRVPKIKSEISENKLFIDLTAYSDIQEFLITSDILISDYSSVVFDYSILNKPFLLFHYDFEKYSNGRGFYYSWDIFPTQIVHKTEDLLEKIKKDNYFNYEKNRNMSDFFNSGDASCKRIFDHYTSNKFLDKNFYEQKYKLICKLDLYKKI